MRKHHPRNERIKRSYFIYLEEAKRMKSSSVDQAAAAIAAFEASTGWREFRNFHIEQARKFKRQLSDQLNPATGKPLAKATIHSRLMAVKNFFLWLAGQPGYKSRISYADPEYFNTSAGDSRIAHAVKEKPVPTLEQIRHTLDLMPADTDIERRDRALIAFTLLSGARDNAIASLSLKHVDIEKRTVFQDAREVRTKNSKTFRSSWFPVGDDIEVIVVDWIAFLRTERLFGPEDPLFPATKVDLGADGLFAPIGLDRKHWKSADSIRRIFKQAFERASLPYFSPHRFRDTLTLLGERICTTPEEFKAWSQNFSHESVLTTFRSYGTVSTHRQQDILEKLREKTATNGTIDTTPDADTIKRVLDHLRNSAA